MYTFKKLPNGNYDVFENGVSIYGAGTSGVSEAYAKSLGLVVAPTSTYTPPPTNPTPAPAPTPAVTTAPADISSILSNPTLAPDQKAIIQSIYDATVSNDTDTAERIKAAMQAATEFSDPYFKAQIRLATDALERGISGKEGDLAYAEQQQRAALNELRANTSASKEYLSMEHAQELKGLETKYQQELATTQDNLAASGFTSSSRRNRAEQILSEENTGLVESSNRKYGYQIGNLDRALSSSDANTQAQIANLQRLSQEGKLDLLRNAESSVGTANLQPLGYTGLLGNVGGDIERQKVQSALGFSSSYIF